MIELLTPTVVKEHMVAILAEAIDTAGDLHVAVPATKITRSVMRQMRYEFQSQIIELVSFLQELNKQVEQVEIPEESE